MKNLVTRQELAERWGCNTDSIAKIEAQGCLPRCPHVPGIRYRMMDVLRCEGVEDQNPMSPFERKRLESEIQERDEEIRQLKEKIRMATAALFAINMEMEGKA